MKRTLLQMVQSILSDMESEHVNSISDSDEAAQIASVIEDTFYNMIVARVIPEHRELANLVSLSDSTKPTHFRFDASGSDSIQGLCLVRYDKSDTSGEYNYQEVYWKEPMDFISGMQYNNDNSVIVEDVNGSTKLAILNDKMPSYYTTFDNEHIVMDSYDSTVDTTLQASKTQAFITKIPTFTISDSFVPDLSDTLKPLLLAEAKSVCFSIFKQGVDPKIDQSARRLKSYTQNDKHKVVKPNTRNHYGR